MDAQRLSDIIGSIYDCVLAPDRWHGTLAAIAKELNLANCVMSAHDLRTSAIVQNINVGIDQDWIESAPKYGVQVLEIWGGPGRASSYPVGEPIIQSQATPRSSWLANAWYRDMMHPRGLYDCVAIVLVRDTQTLGAIAFGRYEAAGEIGEEVLASLRLLAPHLRRAVVIGRLFEQEVMRRSTFSHVLDGMVAGACIVDADMGIIHANAVARTMLDKGAPIGSAHGKLNLANPITNSVLTGAVVQAATREVDIEGSSIDIPVRGDDGAPAVLQVLPLKGRKGVYGLERRAAATVFVSDSTVSPQDNSVTMALLYKLTPAETRVFELIVQGNTPAECSEHLGISIATVRTHLGRVFDKTGCECQAELVALASRSPRVI